MVLQEAFMTRNDLRKKINRVIGEMNTVIITEEGETPQFNAQKKLDEINKLENDLYMLNCCIDHANKTNVESLQKLKYLDDKIRNYTSIRETLLRWNKKKSIGYGEAVQIMQKNLDLDKISNELVTLEKERRDIDKNLQKSNWSTKI